jgi:hypothetical protein
VLDAKDGTFLAMPDNGYGAKNNSGDFLLRLYHATRLQDGRRRQARCPRSWGLCNCAIPTTSCTLPQRPTADRRGLRSRVASHREERRPWFGEEFGPLSCTPTRPAGCRGPSPCLTSCRRRTRSSGTPTRGPSRPAGVSRHGDEHRREDALSCPRRSVRTDTDPRRRIVNEFDLRTRSYTPDLAVSRRCRSAQRAHRRLHRASTSTASSSSSATTFRERRRSRRRSISSTCAARPDGFPRERLRLTCRYR